MKTTKLMIALILSGAMATSVAFAKGKPPVTETATQNLSVPAILVGPLGTLVCGTEDAPSALLPPTGTPLTGYEVDTAAYWWVQKVHTWQAQCFRADTASVFGSWGDNLSGDAKLKIGSPIRVELVLTNSGGSETLENMEGYNVLKLEPSKLDRESAYGHDAQLTGSGSVATPDQFVPAEWVVHDAGMQISVQNLGTGDFVVSPQPIAPEINATGKIVYGYNLRVTAVGKYLIQFSSTPAVKITGTDVGTFDEHNAYLTITVGAGGGKKGGK